MAQLNEVGSSRRMSRCRQAVSIPIDHVGDGCMPTVTEDKAVDQVVGVGCISNCTLEMAVDGPAGDVKGDGAGRGELDNRAMGTKLGTVVTSIAVSINVELGEKGKRSIGMIIILVTFNMGKGGSKVGQFNGDDNEFHYVPIRLKDTVGDWIPNGHLLLDSGNQSGIICGEYASEWKMGICKFLKAEEKSDDAQHALSFGSEGLGVKSFDRTGAMRRAQGGVLMVLQEPIHRFPDGRQQTRRCMPGNQSHVDS